MSDMDTKDTKGWEGRVTEVSDLGYSGWVVAGAVNPARWS